jgi:olfactory receptor
MYYLLANLFLLDLGVSSTTDPKMISDLLKEHKVISFQSCMTQLCFIHITGGEEVVLLTTMAFDRCTAICQLLHYLTS